MNYTGECNLRACERGTEISLNCQIYQTNKFIYTFSYSVVNCECCEKFSSGNSVTAQQQTKHRKQFSHRGYFREGRTVVKRVRRRLFRSWNGELLGELSGYVAFSQATQTGCFNDVTNNRAPSKINGKSRDCDKKSFLFMPFSN